MRVRLLVGWVIGWVVVWVHAAEVAISPSGPLQVLYRSVGNPCSPEFIPDSPARAFRRADGQIALVASHYQNWMLRGRDFGSLSPVCRSILGREKYNRDVRGKLWLQSLYTSDGRRIHALASQDLWEEMRAEGCDWRGTPGRCWLNQIRAATSDDMGDSFSIGEAVATFGETYPSGETNPFGFFSASNIISRNGFYYVFLYTRAGERQEPANCLFRTADLAQPSSWRGWDGAGFNYRPALPQGQCAAVFPDRGSAVRSLQYVSKKRLWIGVLSGRRKLPGDGEARPGHYFAVSSDLIHWSALRRIMEAPVAARVDSRDEVHSYPSLLDPRSASRNFETIDHDDALMLFTVHHLRNGQGTMNRDLSYVPVRID